MGQNLVFMLKYLRHKMSLKKLTLSILIFAFLFYQLFVVTTIPNWQPDMCRDAAKYISPSRSSSIINPKSLKTETDILLFIFSHPQSFERRNLIRLTWGDDTFSGSMSIQYVFLLGLANSDQTFQKVSLEAAEHGDILLEDFHESYYNLTIKSLFMLKFAVKSAPKTKFIFKVIKFEK